VLYPLSYEGVTRSELTEGSPFARTSATKHGLIAARR
jgi:hypothetical protein